MASDVFASFTARDGSGLWEVTRAGIRVNGELWRFTDRSSVICAITPGYETSRTRIVEEEDGIGLWAAAAVYQETGSLRDAALTAWGLGGTTAHPVIERSQSPGTIRLSINGLDLPRESGCSLRYRESGLYLQADAVQRFADAALAAINAFRGI